jgi:hypothetical protein
MYFLRFLLVVLLLLLLQLQEARHPLLLLRK